MNNVDGVFTRYVGQMFITRFIGLLIFFVLLLQMLDLLNNSTEIYAAEGADWRSIAKYISLRAPQIANQFIPFAALLGIVFTLTALNNRSEITIMRAAGMSVQRVLFPMGFFCGLIAAAHFIFNETYVVGSNERLAYWEANEYAVNLPPQTATRTDVRFVNGRELIDADSAARDGQIIRLDGVEIYQLGADGLINNIIKAKSAIFEKETWRLISARKMVPGNPVSALSSQLDWNTNLDPEVLFAISLNPDRTSLETLVQQIRELEKNETDTSNEFTSLLGRFSKPLSTLIMPLLGAIAGYGVTRSGVQLMRAVSGASLGFGYFVIENLMLALGKLGAVPAVLGAFFPFALFLIVGFSILLAMEN